MGVKKSVFVILLKPLIIYFLHARLQKKIWRIVYFAFNTPPPTNVTNMFGNWLNGVPKSDKDRIHIGVSALCWSIWLTRNDIIFNRSKGTNFLQVIFRAVHWIQQWAYLLPEVQRKDMDIGCNRLLMVAHDFYFLVTGWRHINRIANG